MGSGSGDELLVDQKSTGPEGASPSSKYAAALAEFGEVTVVELVAVLGYYTSVAMVLNAFGELPADGSRPLSR